MADAAARRSARIRGAVGKDSGFEACFEAHEAQCGACLLEIDAAGDDGEFVAILDCCRPRHCFHVACILTWAEQENTCPQCKKRFAKIAVYGEDGRLLRATRINEKDQDFGDSDAEGGADEDDVCQICQKTSDEAAMLLCDGQDGRCNNACHYYCVGLKGVPEGDWFCPACSEDTPDATPSATDSGEVAPTVRVKIERTESPVRDTVRPGQIAMDWSPARVKKEPGSEVRSPLPPAPMPAASSTSRASLCTEAEAAEAEAEAAAAIAALASPAEFQPRVKREQFHDEGPRCQPKEQAASPSVFGNLKARPERRDPFNISDPSLGGSTLRSTASSLLHREAAEAAAKEFEEMGRQTGERALRDVKRKTDPSAGLPPRHTKSEAASQNPAEHVNIKAELDGEDSFGGLCKAMPKWISRQGGIIKVDLGGRGMRDAAAVVLAEVIGKALKKLLLGVRQDVELNIALQLAGNQLHRTGLMAILEAVEKVIGVRVLRLDVERNRLDGFAAAALGEWCCRQARGPPDEVHLSSNKICDAGMLKLLRGVGRDRRRRIAAGKPCRKQPIWLELRGNRVQQPHRLLDALSADVPVCLAIDRTNCSSSKCTSCAGSDQVSELSLPSIHLPNFEEQESAEDKEKDTKTSKRFRPEHEAPGARAKPPQFPKPRTEVPQAVAKALSPTSAAYEKAEVRLKSESAIGRAVEEGQRRAAQNAQPRRYVDANGCLHVKGRGRGSDGEQGEALPAYITDPEPDRSSEKRKTDAGPAEEYERRSWAGNLGKKARPEPPAFEFMHKDDAPPSFGLWDVADRDPTKPAKRRRNIGRELLKDLGVAKVAASSSTKTAVTQGPSSPPVLHTFPAALPMRRPSGPVPETPNPTSYQMSEPLVSLYVDNSELLAQTPGLDYRYSMDIDNRYPPGNSALWGSTVRGSVQSGWLKMSDQRYLPFAVSGRTVLRGPLDAAPAPGPPEPAPQSLGFPISRFAPRRPASADVSVAELADAGDESAAPSDDDAGDAAPQDSQPPNDIEVLKHFVNERLRREKRITRSLFSGLDEDRFRMRWRCLRDQLASLAHGKYTQIVASASESWASYLETGQGRARIGSWVQKKLEESAAKREAAVTNSASQRSYHTVS